LTTGLDLTNGIYFKPFRGCS